MEIGEVERKLQVALAQTERDIARERLRKTNYINQINQLSAHITELKDSAEKARMEIELAAGRVAVWVDYLKDEREKMACKLSRRQQTDILSVAVCQDFENNMQLLAEAKLRLQAKLDEIQRRRQRETVELRNARLEIYELKRELDMLDMRSAATQRRCGKMSKSIAQQRLALEHKQRVFAKFKAEYESMHEGGYTSCSETTTATASLSSPFVHSLYSMPLPHPSTHTHFPLPPLSIHSLSSSSYASS